MMTTNKWRYAIDVTSLVRAAMVCVCVLPVPGIGATPSVSAGGSHSLALRADGSVLAWGNDSSGQLGAGRSLFSKTPVTVAGVSGVSIVAAGTSHVIALKADGSVLAWGDNYYGQLGDGSRLNRSTAVLVTGLNNVDRIWARGGHNFARKRVGTLSESRSCAVVFIASAISCALSAVRHRIEAPASVEITE